MAEVSMGMELHDPYPPRNPQQRVELQIMLEFRMEMAAKGIQVILPNQQGFDWKPSRFPNTGFREIGSGNFLTKPAPMCL